MIPQPRSTNAMSEKPEPYLAGLACHHLVLLHRSYHVLPPAYEPYEASPLHDEQWRRTRLVDMAPPLDGPPYLSPLVAPDGSPVAHLAEVTPIPHPQPSNWEFRLLPIADLPNRMDLIALTLVVIIVFFQFMCPIRLSIHWG